MYLIPRGAFAQNATQQDIDLIFSGLAPNTFVNFADLLDGNGFSTNLSHLTVHGNWAQSTIIDFSGCQFESVLFTDNLSNSKLTGNFSNCLFSDVNIIGCLFDHCTLDHCIFTNSTFKRVVVNETDITQNWFLSNEMSQVYFRNNDISKTIFSENSLYAVDTSGNSAKEVGLINTNLTFSAAQDILRIQQAPPKIGIVGVSEWHAPAVKALQYFNASTATIDPYDLPEGLASRLDRDVKKALHHYYNLPYETDLSPAQFVLNSGYNSINELNKIAEWYVDKMDAIWIPGVVFDIHPEFYHQPTSFHTEPAQSYTREMFEFALIQKTLEQEKPIFGVCHGSQMINVYFGGDLFQHVPGQFADQHLQVAVSKGPIGDAIDEGFIGISMHHQAIHHLGEGLELVAYHDHVVKACQASDGSPIFLTQFHPEYLPDSSNAQIINHFVQAASQFHAHTNALELGDVLQIDKPFLQETNLAFKDGEFKYEFENNLNWPSERSSPFVAFEQQSMLIEPTLTIQPEFMI